MCAVSEPYLVSKSSMNELEAALLRVEQLLKQSDAKILDRYVDDMIALEASRLAWVTQRCPAIIGDSKVEGALGGLQVFAYLLGYTRGKKIVEYIVVPEQV